MYVECDITSRERQERAYRQLIYHILHNSTVWASHYFEPHWGVPFLQGSVAAAQAHQAYRFHCVPVIKRWTRHHWGGDPPETVSLPNRARLRVVPVLVVDAIEHGGLRVEEGVGAIISGLGGGGVPRGGGMGHVQ